MKTSKKLLAPDINTFIKNHAKPYFFYTHQITY